MGEPMVAIKLRYVNGFVDARGKVRHVFRAPGQRKITIKGIPGSPDFMTAYNTLFNGGVPAPTASILSTDQQANSLRKIADEYFNSPSFKFVTKKKKNYPRPESTIKLYKHSIAGILLEHGDKSITDLPRQAAVKIIEKIAERSPGLANTAAAVMSNIMNRAIDSGLRESNPFLKLGKYSTGTFHTWTEDEVARYEVRWPTGTRERLAFALMLFTGQRGRSDVTRMRKSHIQLIKCSECDGAGHHAHDESIPCDNCAMWGSKGVIPHIAVKQKKTKKELVVPMHIDLLEIIEATPSPSDFLICNKQYKDQGISGGALASIMRPAIEAAGLETEGEDKCVPHGLRKACARRLAEARATPHQIQSITGHDSLEEVELYTESVNQGHIAVGAIGLIARTKKPIVPLLIEHQRVT